MTRYCSPSSALPPNATFQDIKRRYRELAQVHHPDHGGDHDAFIEVVDAYERLTGHGPVLDLPVETVHIPGISKS